MKLLNEGQGEVWQELANIWFCDIESMEVTTYELAEVTLKSWFPEPNGRFGDPFVKRSLGEYVIRGPGAVKGVAGMIGTLKSEAFRLV